MSTATDKRRPRHPGKAPLLGRGFSWRGVTFLVVNLLVFVAVNAFRHYLATGRWGDFSMAAYRADLSTPLGASLQYPLPVDMYPWMIAVTAGLLAGMIFVPLIVSVMYPGAVAAVFIAVVAVVGHCPGLALAIAAGCVLTAVTPLRSDLPFVAILVGLIPVELHFSFVAFAGVKLVTMKPMLQLLYAVPFLGAIALAVVASAIVLWLTRQMGNLPGVVWPVLAALLAAPVVIFYQRVGADELQYAVIVRSLGPGDSLLPEEALRAWKDRTGNQGLSGEALINQIKDELDLRRERMVRQCEGFVGAFPASKRVPEVLWVEGQARSTQLVRHKVDRDKGLIEYSATWPLAASEACWGRLIEQYPQSVGAAVARWRLGQLAARRGDFDQALETSMQALPGLLAAAARQEGRRNPLGTIRLGVPAADYCLGAHFEAAKLISLIERNRVERARELKEYLEANPCEADAPRRLSELRGRLVAPEVGPEPGEDDDEPDTSALPPAATAPATRPVGP
ncbi:MAG: hypothetical protein NTV86_17985 [Planctomycetota bacterium]|nr:hypothetical protein [Planctomycetota bacterium]